MIFAFYWIECVWLRNMGLKLGDIAPDFTANTTQGLIHFHEWIDKHEHWVILFSHPADFTPVCTTELGLAAKMKSDFEQRQVELIGLSIDSVEHHRSWIKDINEVYSCNLQFPLIGDENQAIAQSYGMLDQLPHDSTNVNSQGQPSTVRSVFIIDPRKRIRLILTYPGKIDEI
jgi:alkyl hydroperoxide reductase subunit AhpC